MDPQGSSLSGMACSWTICASTGMKGANIVMDGGASID